MNLSKTVIEEMVFNYELIAIHISNPHREEVLSTVTVSQTITFTKSKTASSSVKVAQAIKVNVNLIKAFSDEIEFTQILSGYLRKAGITGAHQISDALSAEAQAAYNALTTNSSVSFSRGAYGVVLRTPDWSNKNKYEAVRIQRETKGGTLHVFEENRWPKTEILTLPFSYLTQAQADALMNFMNLTLGLTIRYIDHCGSTWLGVIVNPDAEFRQVSRSNITVSIDFQGELQ